MRRKVRPAMDKSKETDMDCKKNGKCRACGDNNAGRIESIGKYEKWKVFVCKCCDKTYLRYLSPEEKRIILHKALLLSIRENIPVSYCIAVARGYSSMRQAKYLATMNQPAKRTPRRKSKSEKKRIAKKRRERERREHERTHVDIYDVYSRIQGSFGSRH